MSGRTLAGSPRLVGDLRERVPPLAEASRLIGREQVGGVVLGVGLLRLDALVDGRLHHVARRRGGGLAEDGRGGQRLQKAAVHLEASGETSERIYYGLASGRTLNSPTATLQYRLL